MGYRLWIDDVRPAPETFIWIKSVDNAKAFILSDIHNIEIISLDHDAGDYAKEGGDYIKILDWLERLQSIGVSINYTFHIHSMNPVGRSNMMTIITKNHWNFKEAI